MIIHKYVVPRAHNSAPPVNTSPYDRPSGFYGIVTDSDPKGGTVTVVSDTGKVIEGVRVASREWVVASKDAPITGECYLPPKGTYVYCAMPTGETGTAIVLCSTTIPGNTSHKGLYTGTPDIRDIHTPSGYHITEDYSKAKAGTIHIDNGNPATISLDISGDSIVVKGYNATITLDNKGASIEGDKATITLDNKGASIVGDKVTIAGDDYGGLVKVGELKTGLDKLSARVDSILQAIASAMPASPSATDAGETGLIAIQAACSTITDREDFTSIESDTVSHGSRSG